MNIVNNSSPKEKELNNKFKVTFKFNETGLSFNEIIENNFKNFMCIKSEKVRRNCEYK